jgi:uncharacterized membrane protein YphA (DoxX/SURF4 family)
MRPRIGHHVFGLAAVAFGIIGLVWQDFNTWQQIRALNIVHPKTLAIIVAVIEILGGIAIQWKKTMRFGAITLFVIYLSFALLWVPTIIQAPLVYDGWGNFFEQFSLVAGAMIAYASTGKDPKINQKIGRMGCVFLGFCAISFALEQIFYFSGTAGFVPTWIPFGQRFWAIATTIAFALAAIAILTGRAALLACRLLTIMIICFGIFIWLPILFNDPSKMFNWAGNAENLGIAAAAWIAADFLADARSAGVR